LKTNCDIGEYREYIRGIGDSALWGIFEHINKTSVPDRYRAVVQESERRGPIGKDVDDKQLKAWRINRPARKMNRTHDVKRTILIGIRLSLLCVLIAFTIYLCSQHGLQDGLVGGFVFFLAYGGFDLLFLTIWLDDNRGSSHHRKHSCSNRADTEPVAGIVDRS